MDIIDRLKGLKHMRVLVIGETILDEYHEVQPIGKPPKGTHIAARYLGKEIHAGGILACANHIASFCGEADLLTVIGLSDDSEKFIASKLKPNINPHFFYQKRTIIKRRFIEPAYMSKIFEIYENEELHSANTSKAIGDWIMSRRNEYDYDLVLVLDYGHNLFDKELIRLICGLPYFLAVNAQTNTSNFGYNLITKYPEANYFCLDESELRLAYQDRYGDIKSLITNLSKRTGCPGAISVTRGHNGAMAYVPSADEFFEAPVFSNKVVDTTGAGDAFLAVTAPCVARQFPIDMVTFIGNAAGALAVGYLGNKSSIEADNLFKFIDDLLK